MIETFWIIFIIVFLSGIIASVIRDNMEYFEMCFWLCIIMGVVKVVL